MQPRARPQFELQDNSNDCIALRPPSVCATHAQLDRIWAPQAENLQLIQSGRKPDRWGVAQKNPILYLNRVQKRYTRQSNRHSRHLFPRQRNVGGTRCANVTGTPQIRHNGTRVGRPNTVLGYPNVCVEVIGSIRRLWLAGTLQEMIFAASGANDYASSSRERRAKFSVGDDDSSESASTSPKGSPSTENGPALKIGELDPDLTPTPTPQPAWATGTPPRASPPLPKPLSIDTSTAYTNPEDDKAVPFPLLSPEPVATGPPTRKAAVIPRGALSHFTSSFANASADDVDAPATMIRSASSSMIPPSPSLGSPRHLSGPQKNLNGSGHGRSASMADARLDKFGRHSPTESGTCTPVIRKSNGQPLKPSLKSSLSSPNIASMGGPRPIAKSAPATPRVHFKELGLESVVLFDKGARPVAVSGEYGGADDTETETETETTRGYPFPRVPSESPLVRLAPTTSQLALQPPPHSHVHLQYLALPPVRPPRLHGTVLVRNVAFGKSVVVRYTTDNWETASEIMAAYSASLPPGIYPGAGDASWDKFAFTIKLDDIERSLPNRTLFCVVRYDAHGVGEWWDNNNSQNYRVEFERPAEGSGATKPGDQSSAPKPFAPPQFTYSDASLPAPAPVSAPPAPLTKPRSFSTSVVTPPPPIRAPPPVSCGPSPHVLHLRLSNYVSPMANVPKAPLPGKPAEKRPVEKKEEERISPPSSPEHLKRELGLLTSDFGADFQAENRNVFVPSPEVAPLKVCNRGVMSIVF
ncbi:hypothetical protein FRC08_004940 [Ceratobasidium sp. 394]|nr:hypothetical protein FRC08_004940 [Ceratobasidium sp. 394]